jgi:hypothetical protein
MSLTTNSSTARTTPGGRHQGPALTRAEILLDIDRLLQRVNDYAEFMGRIDGLRGSSGEAKDKALAAFHERLVALERQLGQIHEELRLG